MKCVLAYGWKMIEGRERIDEELHLNWKWKI